METLPPVPQLNKELQVNDRVDFEIIYQEKLYLISYEFKIEVDLDSGEAYVDCLEECFLPDEPGTER